jgi:hypothetical protein
VAKAAGTADSEGEEGGGGGGAVSVFVEDPTALTQLEWGVTLTFGFVVGRIRTPPKRKNRTPLLPAT